MSGPSEPSEPSAERRPGLAEERTQLAWGRSGLALVVCGAALLKQVGPLVHTGHRPAAGVVAIAMGAAVWLIGAVYLRRHRTRPTPDASSLRLVAYSTAAVAAAALVITIVPG